jgi:hypothetical protein
LLSPKKEEDMKKLMLLAALLAMLVVAAVPAIAQVTQSNEQENESGDSSQTFTVTGGGDNSNACQGIQGVSNTGSALNNTGILQYASDGSVGVSGGNFEISPSSKTTCDQKVNQAASASG